MQLHHCVCPFMNVSTRMYTNAHTGLIIIHAECTQQGGFKAPHPSACQILSFLLNKVLIWPETLQRSPAALPVALGEHRVGSLLLTPTQKEEASPPPPTPPLSLCGDNGAGGERKRPTLSRGPEMTQHHVPTRASLFRPHRTTLQEPALEKMRHCQDGRLYKPPVNSYPPPPSALAGTSHQTVAFLYGSIKRQNTSR